MSEKLFSIYNNKGAIVTITLNIQQLSIETNLSIKTIRTTLVRNPGALPPRLLISGQKKLLWLREDVENFYKSQVRKHGSNPCFSVQAKSNLDTDYLIRPEKRKRGRPRKVNKIKSGGVTK